MSGTTKKTTETVGAGMSAEEFSDSLTGYEELGIARHFDLDIYADAEARPMVALRALVFTDRVRRGETAAEAKDYAQKCTVGQVMAYFPEENPTDDNVDPAGNGEGP